MTAHLMNPVDRPQTWFGGRLTVRCVRILEETHDVRSFVFQAEPPRLFTFKPGQFLKVHIPRADGAIERCYSISSSPSRPYSFTITVKRVPGGNASSWLHDHLAVGDWLEVEGPHGDFNAVDRPAERMLMLSGGSGATPVMSMARWLHDTAAPVDMHYVHSARSPADVIFRRELEAMARDNPGFTLRLVCERDDASAWEGDTGRLNRDILESAVPDLMSRTVYACGPEPYMQVVRETLGEIGFPDEQYHEESFGGAQPAPASGESAGPPSVAAQGENAAPAQDAVQENTSQDGATVELAVSGLRITCGPNETLLQAAQRAGAWIPCNCQMGVCGTCKVRKTAGAVTMNHLGGLSPEEESDGYVLACCSTPSGHVVLDV